MIQEFCDQKATMDMVKEKLEDEHDDKWGELDSIETSETMNHMMKEKKGSNPKRLTSWTMNSMQMIFMEKKTYHLCNKCESKKRLMIMIQQQLKTQMGSGIWTLLRRKECHDQMVMKAMSSKGFGASKSHNITLTNWYHIRLGAPAKGAWILEIFSWDLYEQLLHCSALYAESSCVAWISVLLYPCSDQQLYLFPAQYCCWKNLLLCAASCTQCQLQRHVCCTHIGKFAKTSNFLAITVPYYKQTICLQTSWGRWLFCYESWGGFAAFLLKFSSHFLVPLVDQPWSKSIRHSCCKMIVDHDN